MSNYHNIPPEMSVLRRWCFHRVEPNKKSGGKPQKVPYQANGQHASSTDPNTWTDFASVQKIPRGFTGLSYALTAADGLVCVDLDGARNPETGATEPWALDIIQKLDSYTEVSPSGTGYHVFVKGKIAKAVKTDHVEIYSDKKIMATTGQAEFPYTVIAERDLTWLVDKYAPSDLAPPSTGDPSRDDFALAARIARMCGCDPEKTRVEFLKHATQRPKLRRPDYVERTIQNAIAAVTANQPQGVPTRVLPSPKQAGTQAAPKHWRDVFHTGAEMDPTPGKIFIKGILEEGITSIGSLSGVGKTWIGLSISHALLSGEPLFGKFLVLNRANVLYLVPEMGGRKFRERMIKMRISMDGGFFCQTIRDGACDLKDPLLLQAVQDMRPVVILDTAIRFQQGEENSSTDQAQGLGAAIFNLINHGAQAVVCMHHRKKTAGDEDLTLENALRGSGDFGAMSDCVWAVEHARKRVKGKSGKWDTEYTEESKQLTRLFVSCVKPRDMEPADPFTIQGRPFIDEKGDFVVIDTQSENEPPKALENGDEKVLEILKENPQVGIKEIMRRTGFGNNRVYRIIEENHWKKTNGVWECEAQVDESMF